MKTKQSNYLYNVEKYILSKVK